MHTHIYAFTYIIHVYTSPQIQICTFTYTHTYIHTFKYTHILTYTILTHTHIHTSSQFYMLTHTTLSFGKHRVMGHSYSSGMFDGSLGTSLETSDLIAYLQTTHSQVTCASGPSSVSSAFPPCYIRVLGKAFGRLFFQICVTPSFRLMMNVPLGSPRVPYSDTA